MTKGDRDPFRTGSAFLPSFSYLYFWFSQAPVTLVYFLFLCNLVLGII